MQAASHARASTSGNVYERGPTPVWRSAEFADISRLTSRVPRRAEGMSRIGTESGHSLGLAMELSSKAEPLSVTIPGRARQKGSRAAHVQAPSSGTQVPTDPKLIRLGQRMTDAIAEVLRD